MSIVPLLRRVAGRLQFFLIITALIFTSSLSAAAGVECSRAFENAVGTEEQGVYLYTAMEFLEAKLKGTPALRDAFRRLADDAAAGLASGLDYDATVGALLKICVNTVVEGDERVIALIAANAMRQDGKLILGIVTNPGPVGSGATSWFAATRTGNRGHYLEMVVALNLVHEGFIDLSKVEGFGLRILDDAGNFILEGDIVEKLASEGLRFIDVKAYNGNFGLGELERARDALLGGRIEEMVFAIERGTIFDGERALWHAKWEAVNDEIRAYNAQNRTNIKTIILKEGGSFL